MKKRILAGALGAWMMLCAAAPVYASSETGAVYSENFGEQLPAYVQNQEERTAEQAASSGTCGEQLTWTLDSSGTLTIKGTGEMWEYNLGWQQNRNAIKKVVVSKGVTSIAPYAFDYCGSLKTVSVAGTVKTIGSRAFSECFNLQTVTLGGGVQTIGGWAFASDVELKHIRIPSSVKEIGSSAFAYCDALIRIYFCGAAPALGDAFLQDVKATVYYPPDKKGWSAAIKNQYGGTLRWRKWDPSRRIEPVEKVFSDVSKTDWFYSRVQYVYDNNLMAGDKGRFMPNSVMNRAMVVQILYNNAKACGSVSVSGGKSFSDVSKNDWFYEAVRWASAKKIASGTGDGRFSPYAHVTREQFAQFLYQDAGAPLSGGTIRFSDAGKVSSWAKSAVLWAVRSGVLSGKDGRKLDPRGGTTRAEAATMLMNYLEPKRRTALTSQDETREEKLARIFGDNSKRERYPSKAEAEKHQTRVSVKVWDFQSGKSGKKVTRVLRFYVNTALADTIEQIFAEIYASGEQFPIYSIGGYSWRGDTSRSEHCLGTALDINPNENYQCDNSGKAKVGSYWRPGKDPYSIPANGIVVRTFAKYGFGWGANFHSSKDYMHFSYFGT